MALLKYISLKIRAKSFKITSKFLIIIYINKLLGVTFKKSDRRVYFSRFLFLIRDVVSRIRNYFRDINSGLYKRETLPSLSFFSLLYSRRLYLERAEINILFLNNFRFLHPKNAR